MKSFREFLTDNLDFRQLIFESSSLMMYHGSGQKFEKFDERKARIVNDFYGGGVAYFTANQSVAIQYAKSMQKIAKTDTAYVYTCIVKFDKLFDVDYMFTGKELVEILPKDIRSFARGASLLTLHANEDMILYKLEVGKLQLTGDEIFKGLSSGMNQTAKARDHLISKGYDGLRYNGRLNMNMRTKHDVYLSYNPENISISKIQKVVKK